MIAAAGDDGEVRFWNFTTFEKCNPKRCYKHKGIQTVQFSEDGTYLVTAAADGSLAVWDSFPTIRCARSTNLSITHKFLYRRFAVQANLVAAELCFQFVNSLKVRGGQVNPADF